MRVDKMHDPHELAGIRQRRLISSLTCLGRSGGSVWTATLASFSSGVGSVWATTATPVSTVFELSSQGTCSLCCINFLSSSCALCGDRSSISRSSGTRAVGCNWPRTPLGKKLQELALSNDKMAGYRLLSTYDVCINVNGLPATD